MRICMDWRSIKFDWNRARAFLVTAEEGSLSAAGRALGMAQPTLGRQVEALEQELGVVLFERFGRGLQLTPAGHDLLHHVRAMGEAASRFSISAYAQNDQITGTVTISASDLYAGILLPPILLELREAEPRISVEIIADNEAADLMRREADIAIRNFRPKEPDLVARQLREANARFYGSKSYVAEHGPFETPADLGHADILAPGSGEEFIAALKAIIPDLTQDNLRLGCSSYMAMWSMAKAGLGLALIDERVGDLDPDTVRVPPDFAPFTFPVWLVAHREILRSRRLRFVFDFLAERLR